MTTIGSPWYTSAATSTAGDYIEWTQTAVTGTKIDEQYTCYIEIPLPLPDSEAIRRHELQERRREPLERWRDAALSKFKERQKKEMIEASECAKRLLFEYLDEKNRKNFVEKKPLEVESGIHQGIKYRIPYYNGRIKACKGDYVVSELCLQVRAPEWIPHEDMLLAKLLYLQNDEERVLRTANHFNTRENLLEGSNNH